MTGDVTGVAQSPFGRASGHFGNNKTTNQIRRYLADRGIEPEKCRSSKLVFYGPLFPYEHHEHGQPRHPDFNANRQRVANLEKRLIHEVKASGYEMLNRSIPAANGSDDPLWDGVRAAFATVLHPSH